VSIIQAKGRLIYVDGITFMRTQPCLADLEKIIVIGQPSTALTEALLYLANLPHVINYERQAAALIQNRRTLPECVPLMTEDTFMGQRAALAAII
jgi:ArsR family metal-binding transcriptional regulator